MPVDPEAQAYLERTAGLPPVYEVDIAEGRRANDETAAALFGPTDPIASVEDLAVAGPGGELALRVYRPREQDDLPTLVYFHGGGWVLGSLETHDGVCRALAARAGCRVVAVDYRLAPEHRFPAAVEDAWFATVWASRLGGQLAVGGDSAGGNLAAVVALRARDEGAPALDLQLLVYPVTDADLDRPSYVEFAAGFGLTREAMRWYWLQYLGPDGDGADSAASPLRAADPAGVAPALVITAGCDPLRDEGEEYASRLGDAGVPVTTSRYDGLIHGFFRMPAVLSRADAALDEAAAALRKAFAR